VGCPARAVRSVSTSLRRLSTPELARDEPVDDVLGLSLVGFECSLDTSGIATLEAHLTALSAAAVNARFEGSPGVEEVARLATCHRLEILLLVRDPGDAEAWARALPGDAGDWRRWEGGALVRHVFEVAAGRHSLAVGEKEVRAQVRGAASSVLSRHPRPLLRDVLLSAAQTAEEAAPTVPSARSVAAVAAARLLVSVGRPFPRVLVVGSGVVGRQVAELLAPSARVTLAYRSRPPDEAFLRAHGVRAVRADRLLAELPLCDAVVTAAKSGDRCIGPGDLPAGPMVLVDLGVPRNIDPAVRERPGFALFDLEDLRSFGPAPDPVGDSRIEAGAAACADRVARLALEPWVDQLRREAEVVRLREVATARPFLGELSPSQAAAVDTLTRRLVGRLLSSPSDRIRALPPGPDGDRWRRFALELLRPGVRDV
jgi:glutamyl-tRNA reductase